MSLGEKIAKLRKENNYTQEQLAEIIGISRQAVSKWESDVAYPETDKLIKLCELYDCSMDYLLKNKVDKPESAPVNISFNLKDFHYERKSAKTVNGTPLWHINIGAGRTANGIVAIGFRAKGLISIGFFSLGLLSLGFFSLGVISIGIFAFGLIAAGSISAGVAAFGAICFGILAFGAIAIGEFSFGALSVGKYFAIGDYAYAAIAIGKSKAVGSIYKANSVTDANYVEIISLLKENVPKIFSWIIEIIKAFFGNV